MKFENNFRTILAKMTCQASYKVSKRLMKTKLKIFPFLGNWDLISIFVPVGPKLEKSV